MASPCWDGMALSRSQGGLRDVRSSDLTSAVIGNDFAERWIRTLSREFGNGKSETTTNRFPLGPLCGEAPGR
jgi:hypothetical protein